jgi:hypothetical protein
MRLTFFPRDNVMNVNVDVATSGDCTPVTRLDQYAALDVCGDRGPASHG